MCVMCQIATLTNSSIIQTIVAKIALRIVLVVMVLPLIVLGVSKVGTYQTTSGHIQRINATKWMSKWKTLETLIFLLNHQQDALNLAKIVLLHRQTVLNVTLAMI